MHSDEIIRAAILGDPVARNAVARWLVSELHASLTESCRAGDDIPELIQLTMVEVWTHAAERSPLDAAGFLDWVQRVGSRTAQASRTRVARDVGRRAKLLAFSRAKSRSLSSKLAHDELLRAIASCIERLATPYRETVIRMIDGAKPEALAQVFGVAASTVRWRFHEAARKIRVMLERKRLMSSETS